jgi:uncharacterized membrane protein YphA (DoxX/SURF4 family)
MRCGHGLYMWTNHFPDGPPGVGLLLARAALGVVCLLQGRYYLTNADTASWVTGVGTLALGVFFAVGLLTPAVAIFGIVGGLLVAFSVIPGCSSTLSHSSYALLLLVTTLVEVLLAGPGAYSIDARLFGRREIIIPRINSSYEP